MRTVTVFPYWREMERFFDKLNELHRLKNEHNPD
jgi:hypothetical protein